MSKQNFKRIYLDPEDLTPTADDSGYRYAILRIDNVSDATEWDIPHQSFTVESYPLPLPVPPGFSLDAISIHQDVSPLFQATPSPL